MSAGVQEPSATQPSAEVWHEQRELQVGKTVRLLGQLVDSGADSPYIFPNHAFTVEKVRRDIPDAATHLVIHRFSRRDLMGEEPTRYEERIVISARRLTIAGYFKFNQSRYESDGEFLLDLGLRRAQGGLSADEEQLFELALAGRKAASKEREQNELPYTELTEAEQASRAMSLNPLLEGVLQELSDNQRVDFSHAVTTHSW